MEFFDIKISAFVVFWYYVLCIADGIIGLVLLPFGITCKSLANKWITLQKIKNGW